MNSCRSYGVEPVENYRYAPMYQYFACDLEAIDDRSFIPFDKNSGLPPEQIPNGPLLDYLRMPYQFQQVYQAITIQQSLEMREQEVMVNDTKMHEIARQELVRL